MTSGTPIDLAQEAIEAGEGSRVEFKREFPLQARDLAHEAAAFASTEGGVILLGVDDSARVIGLPDAATAEGQAAIKSRVEGSLSAVDPGVAFNVRFDEIDGNIICIVDVPRGLAPLYYVDGRAYIRVGSESRPARPAEIEGVFRERLGAAAQERERAARRRTAETLVRLTELAASLRLAIENRGARAYFLGQEESPAQTARWKAEDDAIDAAEASAKAYLVEACSEFLNDWDSNERSADRLKVLDTAIREIRRNRAPSASGTHNRD